MLNEYIKNNKNDIEYQNTDSEKIRKTIDSIGEEKVLSYFNLDYLFDDILLDDKFRFYSDYDVENLSDEEINSLPEIIKLKKEFMKDPIGFYDKNIFAKSTPPKYTFYEGLRGMLYYFDHCFNNKEFKRDYPAIYADAKAEPISFEYDGKKYNIINRSAKNSDLNGE